MRPTREEFLARYRGRVEDDTDPAELLASAIYDAPRDLDAARASAKTTQDRFDALLAEHGSLRAELAVMTKERDEAVRLNDAWKHTADRCADTVDQRIAEAVAAEREACACRVESAERIGPYNLMSLANAIRARGAAKGGA